MNITLYADTPEQTLEQVVTVLENIYRSYNSQKARARLKRDEYDAIAAASAMRAAIDTIREFHVMPKA